MSLIIGVDVGGTFTDFAVTDTRTGQSFHYKQPSTPAEPQRAIVEGLREILTENALAPTAVEGLLHGTTVGTNALIQRRVGRVALVTSNGFRDLIEIGRQVRPRVYDIHLDHPPPIVSRELRFEVAERMRADGTVSTPLDEDAVRALASVLLAERVDCVVVCFLHSFGHPRHERRAVEILRQGLPDSIYVISSTDVYPEFREYERFTTAVLNGALLVVMDRYLDRLTREAGALGIRATPRISQSNGGTMSVDMARAMPIRASLSGPAAGVSAVAYWAELMGCRDVVTLDIGGTSSDVALIRDYTPSEVGIQSIGGFPVRLPALDVTTVGAGGGTIAWIDTDGLLKVGPDSAGADPGPACYGRGGTDATVTDANVFLGRLNNEALLGGRMAIRPDLAVAAITSLAGRLQLGVRETALGILRVATATVVKALRKVSIERSHDPASFMLFAFGGAGPLFAVDVARELGIGTVVVPQNPGILCAEGLHHCALTNDFVRSSLRLLDDDAASAIAALRLDMQRAAQCWFDREAVPCGQRHMNWFAELRYRGQNFELSLPLDEAVADSGVGKLLSAFHAVHARTYGFSSPREPVELVNIKLKAKAERATIRPAELAGRAPGRSVGQRHAVFDDIEGEETPLFLRTGLAAGQRIGGPAIIEQQDATVLVYPPDEAVVDRWGNLILTIKGKAAAWA